MRSLAFLGMAQAAGRLVSGHEACHEALRRGKVDLLVLAGDASDRTMRSFLARAGQLGVPWVTMASKAELGQAIGKPERAVIGVCDAGLARGISAALVSESGEKFRGDVHAKGTRLRAR